MIVVNNGERFTVDTTAEEIEAIFYFSPKKESEGSMTDKGKELIEQARNIKLVPLGTVDMSAENSKIQLENCLSNYKSTKDFNPADIIYNHTLPYNKWLATTFKGDGESKSIKKDILDEMIDYTFREDRLSQANQEKQKSLAEQEVIKQWESKKEGLGVVVNNKGLEDKIKKAIENHTPKSAEELISNFNSYDSATGFKETVGKTDYSEINLGILDLMAERFSANKGKYEKGNSKKPLDKQQILWALFRHVKKMIQPNESDQETFKDHLGATLTNCSILLDQLELEKQ